MCDAFLGGEDAKKNYAVGVKKKVKKKGYGNLLTIPLNNFGHKMVTTFRILPHANSNNSLYVNMGDTGLEPVTPCLSSKGNKGNTKFFHIFFTIFSAY